MSPIANRRPASEARCNLLRSVIDECGLRLIAPARAPRSVREQFAEHLAILYHAARGGIRIETAGTDLTDDAGRAAAVDRPRGALFHFGGQHFDEFAHPPLALALGAAMRCDVLRVTRDRGH